MKISFNRTTLVGLLLVSALMVAACGGGDEPTVTPEPPAPAATDTLAPEPTATTAPTDTPAPAEEPAPTEPPAEEQPAETPAAAEEEEAYPPPEETPTAAAAEAEGAYPPPETATDAGEPEAYPPPVTPTEPTSSIPIVPFVLEKPVPAGATVLRGTGPAGVPILAVNVTFMGEVLGETVISDDGTFEVTVPPLEDRLWVGIALDDLEGTDLTFQDFVATGFNGEDAAQIPQVGFVYDSVTVGQ